jgi:osmotically-inducible protein OsmY
MREFEEHKRMKPNASSAGMALFTMVAVLTAGCVVVVDGHERERRSDAEWSRSWGSTSRAEATSVDGSLALEVQSLIGLDPDLAGQDITVSSSGNVVTLHGRVAGLKLLEQAMRVAAAAPGVSRVVSRITVEMEGA